NPMIVEGQVLGGTAHGIGNALFEWMGFDDDAQPLTANFGEYLLATAPELPPISVRLVEYAAQTNPLGVKGVGEAGCVPAAAAVVSAVEHALAPFAIRIEEAPILPARLFALLRAAS
ncbi:MAG TPA: molybdopterin cofactor-binding domain-containing protein, partial [Stellaceae bacterium]|nr:molybdopterin cofactor-binding domain-containing protein [Stellaceae bacterium]